MDERLNNIAYRTDEAATRASALVELLNFTLEKVSDEPITPKRLYGLLGSFVSVAMDVEKYLEDLSKETNNLSQAISKI